MLTTKLGVKPATILKKGKHSHLNFDYLNKSMMIMHNYDQSILQKKSSTHRQDTSLQTTSVYQMTLLSINGNIQIAQKWGDNITLLY